jgi:adiponectin receptor
MTNPTSNVRKRCVPSTIRENIETLTNRSAAGVITVGMDNAPKWQRDNKYIVRGYRPGNTGCLDVVKSLTFLHNETCNIYTHLIGTLLLPLLAISFLQVLSEPQFSSVSGKDYVVLGTFFWSAECCLVFSTIYHLVGCYSYDVEQFWLRMDLLGIVAVIVGTSVPGIYYAFACEPSLQKLHWTIVRHICSS